MTVEYSKPFTCRWGGICADCGKSVNSGSSARFRVTGSKKELCHSACHNAVEGSYAPYSIYGGSGFGFRGWKPGDVLLAAEHLRNTPGLPEHLVVVSADSIYYPSRGIAHGVGAERGYIYRARCRGALNSELLQKRIVYVDTLFQK